ncbi:MAG: iron-containing redox enzyme family protein [Rhodospirillales bacterium]|nr:iron-containing redox enzyme family protein [Rhodospirillales bacterium]
MNIVAVKQYEPSTANSPAENLYYATHPLHRIVGNLLACSDLSSFLTQDQAFFGTFMERLRATIRQAFQDGDPDALFQSHKTLYLLYEQNLARPGDHGGDNQFHPFLIRVRNEIEAAWEACELSRYRLRSAEVPADDGDFLAFFENRRRSHRMNDHPLFEFLENRATASQFAAFLSHDAALIVRFADFIALTLIGVDDEIIREVAGNFWDEMGGGNINNRHTRQFRRLLEYVGIALPAGELRPSHFIDNLDGRGLVGYNLYFHLSLHRRNYFKSVGSMTVAESMDPVHYVRIVRGLKRLGFTDEKAIAYYVQHAEVDVDHGEGWAKNVMLPLLGRYPAARHDMVLGGDMRLDATADYYDFLLAKLTRDVPAVRPSGLLAAMA